MSLRIRAENFGPLVRADVSLRPLTVFVGPNNSGKSVLAMLVYAISQAARRYDPTNVYVPRRPLVRPPPPVTEDIARLLIAKKDGERLPKPASETIAWIDEVVRQEFNRFGRNVSAQLERSFSARLETMSRSTRRATHPFRVTITNEEVGWRFGVAANDSVSYEIVRPPNPTRVLEDLLKRLPNRAARVLKEGASPTALRMEIGRQIDNRLYRGFPSDSYYLPAERSGILQSHRQLASFVVRQAPFAGIEDLQVPRMSGVVSDFISNLLQLEGDEQAAFGAIAAELEKNVLAGQIAIEQDVNGYPDLAYRPGNDEYPLHRSSSMVSEIAPLVLYLRYVLDKGECLIIEEPESHLHPRSQVAVAEAIARMVGQGLQVLVTTHSDYLLAQINNAIRRATARGKSAGGAGPNGASLVRFSEVAGYIFSPRGSGTRVSALKVTPDEGILGDEFSRVTEDLYEETVRLEDALESG